MSRLLTLTVAYVIAPSLQLEARLRSRRDERGSVTVEHVAWAVAVLVFVGIVVAAIKAYVTSQAGNIK